MLLRGSPRLDIGADEFFNYLLYVASISCFRRAHTRTWHPLFELTGSFALKLREDPGAVIIGTTGDDTVAVQFYAVDGRPSCMRFTNGPTRHCLDKNDVAMATPRHRLQPEIRHQCEDRRYEFLYLLAR